MAILLPAGAGMRVLVIGAYGLIGAYVGARLHRAGHAVTGVGRDRRAAARFPYIAWITADLARMRHADDWRPHLRGIDAVVNCAGALQASPRDDLRGVHVEGPRALYGACVDAGIRRIVHISAAAVAPGRGTLFNATKAEAEALLKGLDADWIILRPGLVLAPAAYGGTALLRGLAAFPGVIPAVHAASLVQLVSVHDVAEAVLRAIEPATPARLSIDLVSAERPRLADLLTALRAWLGIRPAPVVGLPPIAAVAVGRVCDGLARLGWRSPMRSTAIEQLRLGIAGDPDAARPALGFEPMRLADLLAAAPSGVQERWFARLYFVKPLGLAGLALFWLASGLLGLFQVDRAAAVLRVAGWPATAATLAVIGGGAVDIGLAGLACFRRTAPVGLAGMILASLLYLAAATVVRPDLWADPLGPLVKIVPGAILALALLAMLDER